MYFFKSYSGWCLKVFFMHNMRICVVEIEGLQVTSLALATIWGAMGLSK